MALYIYIDDDFSPRWMKDVAGRIMDFSEDSIGLAIQLVLSHTADIEKNKVYGPFDVPSYVREESMSLLRQGQSSEQHPMTPNSSGKNPEKLNGYWTQAEFHAMLDRMFGRERVSRKKVLPEDANKYEIMFYAKARR